jgi:peptidyl-dipeptidase Dcp
MGRVKIVQNSIAVWIIVGAISVGAVAGARSAMAEDASFGPSNPFFTPSTLPFQAPPFDKIKDEDYLPAIEAGMAQELTEMQAIANDPAAPTFGNTLIAMETSGRLLERAIHLNEKLFARVSTIYKQRRSLRLDPESQRLLEITYAQFVHAGAKLAEGNKAQLMQLNEEASTLSNRFNTRLLAATKDAAYRTSTVETLAGLSAAQVAAAAQAAGDRQVEGYVLPLQNTTQQPALATLSVRTTRAAIFQDSWIRAERGDANDTRDTIVRLAQVRAQSAALLGFPNHAAWKLDDQMAKTPETALKFMAVLVPLATGKARREALDIQAAIDADHGDFRLEPWDWSYYAEKVRAAKYALNDAEIKPYFELGRVLENGVFYAAHRLYGIRFKERKDIPVWHPDVRVFEVFDVDGKPLALFYCDYFKRDNKNGGAWMSTFVEQSKLLGTLPVVYNVANLPKPAPGQPALISFTDVTAMFHEFGHALHGMFANTEYPSLSGANTARDFVEFPSQFNEHWAIYPAVFMHYARHYRTGAPMPAQLVRKIKNSENCDEGYRLTELLAAAELDMRWHTLPASAPLQNPDEFEKQALAATRLDLTAVPPRYRSSYFSHIWTAGYSAGYYAYLWTQMLDDDAFQWFEQHGGLTRANGDRFRRMVLSRGNTRDLAKLYADWRGRAPTVDAMMKYRDLKERAPAAPR